MTKRFEYNEIPPAQLKAYEDNAAKAVEEMMAGADQDLRDAVDMEIPPEDGISPTHQTADAQAEKITEEAAAGQLDIDDLPWYVQKPATSKWDKLLQDSGTKLPDAGRPDEAAESTTDMPGEHVANQPDDAPRGHRIRKMFGRFFRAQANEQTQDTPDEAPAATSAVETPGSNESILGVELGDEDIEQTAGWAADIGKDAAEVTAKLIAENNLNYTGTEMVTRAAAGLYNGNGIDVLTYNRLPEVARLASHKMAEACASYFVSIGLRDDITSELTTWAPPDIEDAGPADVEDAYFDRVLINKMNIHVYNAGREEDQRLRGEMYGGLAHNAGGGRIETTVPDPARMREEQLANDFPYSEAGIKQVLHVFGENLGPVVQGLHDVAPMDISRRDLLKNVAFYISAAKQATEPKPRHDPSKRFWE